jgi:hypothetical protein
MQFAPHRIDGGLIGGLLIAAPAQARGGNSGALGDADEFESQDAVDDVLALDDKISHENSYSRSMRMT